MEHKGIHGIHVIYEDATETIRQLPENYIIAHHAGLSNNRWVWLLEPDLAADVGICVVACILLLNFEYKHGSGEMLAQGINNLIRRLNP